MFAYGGVPVGWPVLMPEAVIFPASNILGWLVAMAQAICHAEWLSALAPYVLGGRAIGHR